MPALVRELSIMNVSAPLCCLQVTFTPGLDGLGERLLAKKRDAAAKKAETVWDAYLRRKRCARRPQMLLLRNPT